MLRKVIGMAVIFLVFVLVIGLLHDYWWRCSSGGLNKDFAISIANEKLNVQEKKYKTEDFFLRSEKKEDGVWMFTYEVEDCVIYIFIDKCGVADVGGLAHGCF